MKRVHRAGASAVRVLWIGALVMLSVGCSEQRGGDNEAMGLERPQELPDVKPMRPEMRRTAVEVAQFIQDTCLAATQASTGPTGFEAILRRMRLDPQASRDCGRLKVWQMAGVEAAYSGRPKGAVEHVICHLKFDVAGAPKAAEVARAITLLIDKGKPSTFLMVEPTGPVGYRWKFTAPAGRRTELSIGDMPELCDHELGCTPPVLDVYLTHAKDADPR